MYGYVISVELISMFHPDIQEYITDNIMYRYCTQKTIYVSFTYKSMYGYCIAIKVVYKYASIYGHCTLISGYCTYTSIYV